MLESNGVTSDLLQRVRQASLTVMEEGRRLYGNVVTSCVDDSPLSARDDYKFYIWARSSDRCEIFEDCIREILLDGKYAPHAGCRSASIRWAIGRHPEIFELVQDNGYDLFQSDKEAM